MLTVRLEDIIRQYVTLDSPNAQGWHSCVHKKCDHGRKGPRAAFLFEGDSTTFHCFNCGVKTGYDPHKHHHMSKKMVDVLNDFDIPESDWKGVLLTGLASKNSGLLSGETSKESSIEPVAIQLPSDFYKLELDPDNIWTVIAWEYLESRMIDPASYPFYLSRAETQETRKYKGRVIIPIYKDNKLIYFQGRDLTDKKKKKYESPNVPKDKLLFGYDQLFKNLESPLYVMEGWFDAYCVDGIACFGNVLSKSHIKWLNLSPREKIIVPDKKGNGAILAEQGIAQNWGVSLPDLGEADDINKAIVKYGKLYVLQALAKGVKRGYEAEVAVKLMCKQ